MSIQYDWVHCTLTRITNLQQQRAQCIIFRLISLTVQIIKIIVQCLYKLRICLQLTTKMYCSLAKWLWWLEFREMIEHQNHSRLSVYGKHIQHHREIPSKARVHLCQNYTIKLMKKDELHVYCLMIWGYGWLMLIIVRAYSNSLNTDTYWKHNKNNVQVSRMCLKTLCAMHFLLSLQLIFS